MTCIRCLKDIMATDADKKQYQHRQCEHEEYEKEWLCGQCYLEFNRWMKSGRPIRGQASWSVAYVGAVQVPKRKAIDWAEVLIRIGLTIFLLDTFALIYLLAR